jgi:pantoate--beta-alanine ligase
MQLFKEGKSLSAYLHALREADKTIGFVPTMGALHQGHLSLLETARLACDVVVCSIFVNPTQFNDPQDFDLYPRRTDLDVQQLLESGTHILFLPGVEEIYPEGTGQLPVFDFSPLDTLWEGAFRPGHFQGVGQVMERLLRIVLPDQLFMGEKDYQQILIINKLLRILAINAALITCPTLRETDGLAMSSRNARLSTEARAKAPLLYATLQFVRDRAEQIPSWASLSEEATDQLNRAGFQVEYLSIVSAADLHPLPEADGSPAIIIVAAWLDGIRLIDNLALKSIVQDTDS